MSDEGVTVPAFPTELTKSRWNDSFGRFSKARRSGIGDALSRLQGAFADSAFTFDPYTVATKTADPEKFERWMTHLGTRLQADAAKIEQAADSVQAEIAATTSVFADDASVSDALGRLQTSLVAFRASIQPGGPLATQFDTDVRAARARWEARQAAGSGP